MAVVGSSVRQSEALDWALRYLPEYFSDTPCDFHRELLGDLSRSEQRLIARVAPRGHGKSACAALAYPLWSLCERKRRNIVIITHEASLATQFLLDIRQELETNERILEDYGDLCAGEAPAPKPGRAKKGQARSSQAKAAGRPRRRRWSSAKFTTTTDITVQAKGVGAGFRGTRVGAHRPDLIICDDIEKDELVATPEGRRKLEYWLRRVVMPALGPQGQLLVLGSILHYDSLLSNLRDPQRFPRWDYRVYRALEAQSAPDGSFRYRALWPGRWPVEKLLEERERVGTLAFEQEYQANPIDTGLRVFQEEWLRPYDPGALEGRTDLIPVMAVDPATGAQGGDFFALWVGQVDPRDGVIYTRELSLQRIGVVEQVRRIIAAFERWRPVKLGIETTAYQVALKEILEERSRQDGLYMPIVGIQALQHKRARIEGTTPFYENGLFRLPPGLDPETLNQFLHFPAGRHDDAPDVCAMGIELARSVRRGGRVEGLSAGRRVGADW